MWFQSTQVTTATEKRVLLLDATIGPETLQSLREKCAPDFPQNKSYYELCTMIEKIYASPWLIFHERKRFYGSVQNSDETVGQWFFRLQSLAKYCKFGALNETMMVDKFVTGLNDGRIISRLSEDGVSTLTIAKALEIAQNYEKRFENAKITDQINPKGEKQQRLANQNHHGNSFNPNACKHCGSANHKSEVCYKYEICESCNRLGHIAKNCRSTK